MTQALAVATPLLILGAVALFRQADGLRRGPGPWLGGGQQHPPGGGVGFAAVHRDRP